MVKPKPLARFKAIMLVSLFALSLLAVMIPSQVSAGVVTITIFDGDLTEKELDFDAQRKHTDLGFKIPKESVAKDASMDLQAIKVQDPDTILIDTKDEMHAAEPVNLDLNKTWGTAYLIQKENLTDDFNDGDLNLTNWTWTNPPQSYNENPGNGRLEIVSEQDTAFFNDELNGHFVHRPVTGNFMLKTKFYANPNGNYEHCGVVAYSDDNNYLEMLYRWWRRNDNGERWIYSNYRSSGNFDWHRTPAGNIQPLYFQLTRYQNQWTTHYSRDDVNWTPHRQWNQTLPTTIELGFVVADGHNMTNFQADLDYFHIWQHRERGTFHVGPVTTPYPVKHVYMEADLAQLRLWETFKVEARANSTASFETILGGDPNHFLSVAGTEVEINVEITGMGWTTPTLRSVTFDFYPESWPSDVTIDIGNDGSVEWT